MIRSVSLLSSLKVSHARLYDRLMGVGERKLWGCERETHRESGNMSKSQVLLIMFAIDMMV